MQYAIVTDLNRCVGCLVCSVSCKIINGIPVGKYWQKVIRIGPHPVVDGGQFPDVEFYYLPVGCQHCENPLCVKVCPTGASHKEENGTVQIDKEKCIGCQFCAMACPYNVRYLNEDEKVVEKCTLCNQLTAQGELPQCVAQCGGRARYFGDLDKDIDTFEGPVCDGTKENIAVRTTVADALEAYTDADVHTLPDVGNKPSFRYILRTTKWRG